FGEGMKILIVVFLLLVQTEQGSNKWECSGEAQPLPREQLTLMTARELKARVVACAVPHLPGSFDGQGTVLVEVQVDESGNVRCARVFSGSSHPVMNRAALDAAKLWKFKPLITDGQAKPFTGFLSLLVSWDPEKADEQCSKE